MDTNNDTALRAMRNTPRKATELGTAQTKKHQYYQLYSSRGLQKCSRQLALKQKVQNSIAIATN